MKLLIIFFFYKLFFLISLNIQAEPVGLSCYYDTGVKEVNGASTDEEYENKTFGMMLDTEVAKVLFDSITNKSSVNVDEIFLMPPAGIL